jgi:hypothetical protein
MGVGGGPRYSVSRYQPWGRHSITHEFRVSRWWLTEDLGVFIAHWNDDPTPFIWKKPRRFNHPLVEANA